jgi:hypothetical protein
LIEYDINLWNKGNILNSPYTVLHMFTQLLLWARNQGNHQNFDPSLLLNKLWLSQENIFFWKIKFQNGRLKKTEIFKTSNSQKFFAKILWIGPWVSRIDWCEGHWCGSTYMVERLSDISPKQPKNSFFVFLGCFWAYVGQLHDHMDWATSMPFASINPTNPRTNPWNSHEKNLRIGGFENPSFFESAILKFFLQKKKKLLQFPWKSVKTYRIARMGQNFDDYPGFPQIPGMPILLQHSEDH